VWTIAWRTTPAPVPDTSRGQTVRVPQPLGKLDHGQRRDPPRRPRERTLDMLSSTVLAIAGTGYGLIGLLVIIVLVLLIIRLV
jgi:hypothetical protein